MSSQTSQTANTRKTAESNLARARARTMHGGLAVLIAMSAAACGEEGSTVIGPEPPGTIVLTVETTGFLKDDSYELMVDGSSQGTVAANDEVTLAELEAATYELALDDVAANCSVDGVSVDVSPDETVNVTLTVTCAYATSGTFAIRFNRDRPDLETGDIAECPFGICPSGAEWDLYIHYNPSSDPHSVVRQNQDESGEIAHLEGVSLGSLTEADVNGASFTSELVADPFDSGRVILIRTDQGYVYALSNPVEDTVAQTLTFDAALLMQP